MKSQPPSEFKFWSTSRWLWFVLLSFFFGSGELILFLQPLLAQAAESGASFNPENFDFWADQCVFLSEDASEAAEYEQALIACETALNLRPNDDLLDLRFARAQTLFEMGDYAGAMGSFRQVVSAAPKDSISMAYQCAALFQLGHFETAVDVCDQALQINGSWGTESPAIAWYYRGRSLQSMSDFARAIESYDRAVAIAPDEYEPITQAWRCEAAVITQPASDQTQALCSLADVVDAYDAVLADNPNDASLWFRQGWVLEQLGRFERAGIAYRRAIALRPNHSLTLAHQCAVLNEVSQYEAALATCDAALAGDGNWDSLGPAYAWSQRSAALIGMGEYELALTSADTAITLDATYPSSWNNRAVSLWHLNNLHEARDAIRQARAEADKKMALLTENFTQTYLEPRPIFYRRQVTTAHNSASILLDLYAKNPDARAALLHEANILYASVDSLKLEWDAKLARGAFIDNALQASISTNRAFIALEQDNTNAINYAYDARNLSEDSFEIWLNIGIANATFGDFDAARDAYKAASVLDPQRLDPADIEPILGRMALEIGQPQEAWNIYTGLSLQDPTNADAVVGQGLALQGLGSGCELQAIRVFERALNLNPAHPVAQQQYVQLLQAHPSFREVSFREMSAEPVNCPIVLRQ